MPISFRTKSEKNSFICHLGSFSSAEFLSPSGRLLLKQSTLSIPMPPGIILSKGIASKAATNKDFLSQFVQNELHSSLFKVDKELKIKLGHKRPGPLFSLNSLDSSYSFDFIGLNEKNIYEFEPYCPDGKAIYLNFLRLIKDLSSFIFRVPKKKLAHAWEQIKNNEGVLLDSEVSSGGLQEACLHFLQIFKNETGRSFPESLDEQIELLLNAIFLRWQDNAEDPVNAIIGEIPPEPELLLSGMVFSNLSAYSGQGTIYSRNPANGESEIYGDYLQKRGSIDIFGDHKASNTLYAHDILSLQYLMPSVFNELVFYTKKIESSIQATVRIDFTIEDGTLFITNLGKSEEQPLSMLKSMADLVKDGGIDQKNALIRIDPQSVLDAFLQSETFELTGDFKAAESPSTGLCIGKLKFSATHSEEQVILFRENDAESPELFDNICGVIALKGTKSSPFFQYLRAKNLPSLLLGDDVAYDRVNKSLTCNGEVILENDVIAVDANAKKIMLANTLFPNIAKKQCSLPFFDPIRKTAHDIKDIELIPCLNEDEKCLADQCCLNLDSLLTSLQGGEWSFFLGTDEEKKDCFNAACSLLTNKLSAFFLKNPKIPEMTFLFPKEDQNALASYLEDKPKCKEKAAGIMQSLQKNHITFEEACPQLFEAITVSIAKSFARKDIQKTVFCLQNIHHKNLFSTIKQRIIGKLKEEGRYALIGRIVWGLAINPSALPEEFSALIPEADVLLFDLRSKEEKEPPYEILRLAIKEAKERHPALKMGLIREDALSIKLASFAERNGLSMMVTRPYLIDSCLISAAKEHIFPKIIS